MTTPKILEVYTESTPNPKMLKFIFSSSVLPNKTIECKTVEEAKEKSPLAETLFRHSYIDSVFISNNFITLSKNNDTLEWYELSFELRDFLKNYILSGKDIINETFLKNTGIDDGIEKDFNDIELKIFDLLEKYVRPAVEMDGGNITLDSYNNGTVKLILQGACAGCPSSSITLKDGIEAMLKRMIPEIKEVVAITEN